MKVKQISQKQLIVSLSYRDLLEMGFTYHSLNYKCEKAKAAINKLFHKAAESADFDTDTDKLLIEAFPAPDMGCVLYFTNLHARKKWRKSDTEYHYTFEFLNINDMLNASKQLHLQNLSGGKLYKIKDRYRLLLPCTDKSAIHAILSNYAMPLGRTGALAAHTAEHGKLISSNISADIGAKLN